MKRIIALIIAVATSMVSICAQHAKVNTAKSLRDSKVEILTHLVSLPDVSVTYLTRNMLQRLPKDKAKSPLAILADKADVESIRLFKLGNGDAEASGKKLIDIYISEVPDQGDLNYTPSHVELLMFQNNSPNELLMYGISKANDIYRYHTILMYSKSKGKKTILIIISGNIDADIIGELIDSFSE